MSARPNILWIVTDHQVHANHNFDQAAFPLQHRLAATGINFTSARTVLPVCSPARASMLTGLYPHAHGLTENDGRFGGRAGLNPDDWLVHQPLLDAGYRCAWFGKWHLDNQRSAADYGFEGFSLPGYGYPYATPEYAAYLKASGLKAPEVHIELRGESGRPEGTTLDLTAGRDWFDYEAGCARLEGPVETHEAFFLATAAGAWLEDVGEDPFFLRVDPWGPHPPYIVGGPYEGSVDPDSVALPENFDTKLSNRPQHHADYSAYWANTLSLTDREWRLMAARAQEHTMLVEAAMVQILETLDVLDLTDRTLVIFCADHGDAVASNGRVSNKGGLMVEETMRVPLLVAGPGLGTASVDERLATNMDLPATILDYCGVSSDQNLHGRSLLGSRADGRGALMTQHYGLHERLIQRALYQQNWKYVIQESGFEELYDLETDPFELDNLSHASSSRQLLQQMRRDLLSEMNRTGDGEPAILSHLASATSS